MFSWISNLFRVCLGEVWASNELAYSGCAHLPRLLLYLFKQTAILRTKFDGNLLMRKSRAKRTRHIDIAAAAAGQSLRF